MRAYPPKPGYVYCITNLVNGKKYVGKTNGPIKRWRDHRNDCLNPEGIQYEKLLYRAMRKHGVENFTYEILQEYPTEEDALDDEDRWIEKLQSRSNQHGYNCTAGGAGPDRRGKKRKKRKGIPHTEKSKKKLGTAIAAAHEANRQVLFPQLQKLHEEGLSNTEISEAMDLGIVTVRKWLARLGRKSTHHLVRPKEELIPEIIELSGLGHTPKDISRMVHCREKFVRKTLKERNLPINVNPRVYESKPNLEFESRRQAALPIIYELCDQGKSKEEIRKVVDLGVNEIKTILGEYRKSSNFYEKQKQADIITIHKLRDEGKTVFDIMAVVKRGHPFVSAILKEYNKTKPNS